MNILVKEKIRSSKEEIRTLDFKKESLLEKMEMQKNLINEIESRGKESIGEKNDKIKSLEIEVDTHIERNKLTEVDITDLLNDKEEVTYFNLQKFMNKHFVKN